MRKLLVLLIAAVGAYATPPTITTIRVNGIFHAGAHFEIITAIGVPVYCQIEFGTVSGVYPYTTGVAKSQPIDPIDTGPEQCAMGLGGLEPNKTYYARATVWPVPDQNTNTNICNVDACGAYEQVFTTSAEPTIHPELPVAATTWTPVEPNTTGYSVITLTLNGSNTCVVGSTSGPKTNWTATVNAGDPIETFLPKIWYQTVVRIPQGSLCYINQFGSFLQGVELFKYAIPPGPTDWVVFETAPGGAADFPPFGFRVDASFANHLGTLAANGPMMPSPGSYYGGTTAGNMFNCSACGANNIWFRNLEIQGRNDTSVYPVGTMDPPQYGIPFSMRPSCNSQGLDCNPDDPATSPDYIVMDRLYMPLQAWPYRQLGCFSPGGNHWLIIGTLCETDVWQPAIFPEKDPSYSGAVITVPYAYTKKPTRNDARVGMPQTAGYTDTFSATLSMPAPGDHFTFTSSTVLSFTAGDLIQVNPLTPAGLDLPETVSRYIIGTVFSYNSGTRAMDILVTESSYGPPSPESYTRWDVNRPNQITFSGASLGSYTGQVLAWLDSSGLNVRYQSASGVTAACRYAAGCNVSTGTITHGDFRDVPDTGFWYFSGLFSGGSYTTPQNGFSYQTFHWTNPSRWNPWKPLGVFPNSGRYGIYRNNYMQAIGQTVYSDVAGKITDDVFNMNYWYFPRNQMENNPTWDGTFKMTRNIFELKECVRCAVYGNFVDGSMSQQNTGAPLYIAGSYAGTFSGGTIDWDVHSNVFRHIATGIQCNGGGTAQPPDPVQAKRLRIVNNMFLDLNKDLYSNNVYQVFGPSLITGWFSMNPGCADTNISSNTVGQARGWGPAIIMMGGSGVGPSVMGEGFKYTKNFIMTAIGQQEQPVDTTAGGNFSVWNYQYFTTFPISPFLNDAHTGTWGDRLNSYFIRTGTSVVPNWNVGYNVLVPGQVGTPNSWFDIPQSGGGNSVDYINTNWASVDSTTRIIQGNTQAARLASAGWSGTLNLAGGRIRDYLISASPVQGGAAGANIYQVMADAGVVSNISVAAGASTISFTYVAPDVRGCSADVSTDNVTWTRGTSGGGNRNQGIVISGLTASTLYYYRLLCYFNQTAAMEFDADQITMGSISTKNTGSAVVQVSYTLTGTATQMRVSYVPASGSTVTQVCTSSPCTLTVPNGVYRVTLQPETGGASPVGAPNVESSVVIAGVTTGLLFDSATGLFDSATGLFDSH